MSVPKKQALITLALCLSVQMPTHAESFDDTCEATGARIHHFYDEDNRLFSVGCWYEPAPVSFYGRLWERVEGIFSGIWARQTRAITIDAGDANQQLNRFHVATGIYILFNRGREDRLPAGITTHAIRNETDWQSALRHMMLDTAYRVVFFHDDQNILQRYASIDRNSEPSPERAVPDKGPRTEIVVQPAARLRTRQPFKPHISPPARPRPIEPPEQNCICGATVYPQEASDFLHWCLENGNAGRQHWTPTCDLSVEFEPRRER